MKGLLKLTNDDDWEGYYTWNPDIEKWALRIEGHTVSIDDVLAIVDVLFQEAYFDFEESGSRCPDEITQEAFDALED